jgi:hypothetical protein
MGAVLLMTPDRSNELALIPMLAMMLSLAEQCESLNDSRNESFVI